MHEPGIGPRSLPVANHLIPPGLKLARSMIISPDMNMLSEMVAPWDFKEEIDVGIIGVPFDFNRNFQGTGEGPNAIREAFLAFASRSFDFETDISDLKVRDIGDIRMHPTEVLTCHSNIREGLAELYKESPDFIPIVIGGNHAIAAPSIRAFREGNDYKRAGLIDFDAHNDLGDPSFSGPTAGTMFRQVIDAGYIEGRNAVQIGLHGSLAAIPQREYAQSKGIREIPAREVWQRGVGTVMNEAIAQASEDTDAIYVSFDIDAIEDASAPGTGVPAPGGMAPREAIEAVYMLGKHPKVKALDLVEVDPLKDIRNITSRMAIGLLVAFLVGLKERRLQHG